VYEIPHPDSQDIDRGAVYAGGIRITGQFRSSAPATFFEVQIAELLFEEPQSVSA
jgi:hypothetical protein